MNLRPSDTSTLCLIAERYFKGEAPERIAAANRMNLRLVTQRLNRLEAVVLLLAHEFPIHLIARVTGLRPEEAHLYLDEVREHLGGTDEVRDFVARQVASERGGPARFPGRHAEGAPVPVKEGAVQALETLDLWVSKWLY
jgi:hypothetical protein